MQARTTQLTEEVKEAILAATIQGNSLRLSSQLDRPTYVKVDKALQSLGGKWNSRAKAHIFPDEARALEVRHMADNGEYVDPRANGYFPTPKWLVEEMVAQAEIHAHHKVLEPSAGQGAIADELSLYTGSRASIDVCEILHDNAIILQEKGYNFLGYDFLTQPFGPLQYNRIVMNPPFLGLLWADHILRAYELLDEDDGRLVAIAPAGIMFRTDRKSNEIRTLVEMTGLEVQEHPENTFKEVGTGVRTVTIVIDR